MFVKSAQHAHARMIAIIVEKGPNPSHLYDHGFMNNTNCRFAPTCIALAQTYNDTKQFQLTIYFYKNITQSIG